MPSHMKESLIGAALAGCGYGLMQGSVRVSNGYLVALLFFAGITAFIIGVRTLWTAWKKSRDVADEKRKPPSIL
jgi:hypothetical protein